ncbi:Protease Do-like 2 chloroplastic [Zea mays]|uniref:Protease Do-like 2 chloroplastic n=1 Tax=Zea mays TaxID=4577 RepID=A0A1D6FSB3_MAIZE|nr:Protease Do-like 2 chloroplastic [Zea mays]
MLLLVQVKVKRRGDDKKYIAKVLARGVECDLALLSIENEEFWRGTEALHFGRLPCLQFEFLGKDSIRYFNTIEIEELVYKAIEGFCAGKKPGQDLFTRLIHLG